MKSGASFTINYASFAYLLFNSRNAILNKLGSIKLVLTYCEVKSQCKNKYAADPTISKARAIALLAPDSSKDFTILLPLKRINRKSIETLNL